MIKRKAFTPEMDIHERFLALERGNNTQKALAAGANVCLPKFEVERLDPKSLTYGKPLKAA